MRATLLIFVSLFALHAQLLASDPAFKCLDAESGWSFSTKELIPIATGLGTTIPRIEHDPDGKPTGLVWDPLPEDTSVETERVGRHRGKAIYRILYRKRNEAPDHARMQVIGALFGYQDIGPNGIAIRPFFVSMDDETRWLDSHFDSTMERPFSLSIHKTWKGNGVFWNTFTFVFTPTEARLLEHSEGGRKMHTKTRIYDKSGKVISRKTSPEN